MPLRTFGVPFAATMTAIEQCCRLPGDNWFWDDTRLDDACHYRPVLAAASANARQQTISKRLPMMLAREGSMATSLS